MAFAVLETVSHLRAQQRNDQDEGDKKRAKGGEGWKSERGVYLIISSQHAGEGEKM